jgi:hypothetical protein
MAERDDDLLRGQCPRSRAPRPVVYGSPQQVAVWLDSVRRLLALEPDEVLADPQVQKSARQLAGLLSDRPVADTHPAARPGDRPSAIPSFVRMRQSPRTRPAGG